MISRDWQAANLRGPQFQLTDLLETTLFTFYSNSAFWTPLQIFYERKKAVYKNFAAINTVSWYTEIPNIYIAHKEAVR